MSRPRLRRLSAADLTRLLADCEAVALAVGPEAASEAWAQAAERRWGCCGVVAEDDEGHAQAVVVASPSLHAPRELLVSSRCTRAGDVAVQLASWARGDDVRLARAVTVALAADLATGRVRRLESVACRYPALPTAAAPTPRWLEGCGFSRRQGLYVLDVSATARWQARAAVRWLADLPAKMPAPRPAVDGSTGRAGNPGLRAS